MPPPADLRPHDLFKYRSADEVAECWDGVSADLYKALWNDVVHVMPFTRPGEDDTYDFDDSNVLANFWHLLTDEHKVELNELALVEARDLS